MPPSAENNTVADTECVQRNPAFQTVFSVARKQNTLGNPK
jgi:hypothetical protein